jgi:KaiC/GvpD/RAD55 family RecA-like ATPase
MSQEQIAFYRLDVSFQRLIAQYCAGSPAFWARMGSSIDANLIKDDRARTVIRTCAIIAKDTGLAPRNPIVVKQRLRTLFEDGKINRREFKEAATLIKGCKEEIGFVSEDSIVGELAPIIRRHVEKVALKEGFEAFAKKQDLNEIVSMLTKARTLGQKVDGQESKLGLQLYSSIVTISDVDRLTTGLEGLDSELEGGLHRGTYTVLMGSTNAGKSMMIDSIVAESISNRKSAAIATLELVDRYHYARVIGNLTDVPVNDILRYPDMRDLSKKRLRRLIKEGILAPLHIRYFSPNVTSVEEIVDWFAEVEAREGYKLDVKAVDHANLVDDPKKKTGHEKQESVSSQFRDRAAQENNWWITGAQADASGMDTKKTKKLESHHSAYSKGIPRAADILITINPRGEEGHLYHVAKHRLGRAGGDVGPLPTDFIFGRMSAVNREGWPKW